jgi:hypothetical protein
MQHGVGPADRVADGAGVEEIELGAARRGDGVTGVARHRQDGAPEHARAARHEQPHRIHPRQVGLPGVQLSSSARRLSAPRAHGARASRVGGGGAPSHALGHDPPDPRGVGRVDEVAGPVDAQARIGGGVRRGEIGELVNNDFGRATDTAAASAGAS